MGKWRFYTDDGAYDFTLDFNPALDTSWMRESVWAEHHPIGTKIAIMQTAGLKARARTIEGIIKDNTVWGKLRRLFTKQLVFHVVDHRGTNLRAFFTEQTWQELLDASNPDWTTFKYRMKIVLRERETDD